MSLLYSKKHSDEEKGSPTQAEVFDRRNIEVKIHCIIATKTAVFREVKQMDCAYSRRLTKKSQMTSSWKLLQGSFPSPRQSEAKLRPELLEAPCLPPACNCQKS